MSIDFKWLKFSIIGAYNDHNTCFYIVNLNTEGIPNTTLRALILGGWLIFSISVYHVPPMNITKTFAFSGPLYKTNSKTIQEEEGKKKKRERD